jgi:hypothetical protein
MALRGLLDQIGRALGPRGNVREAVVAPVASEPVAHDERDRLDLNSAYRSIADVVEEAVPAGHPEAPRAREAGGRLDPLAYEVPVLDHGSRLLFTDECGNGSAP